MGQSGLDGFNETETMSGKLDLSDFEIGYLEDF